MERTIDLTESDSDGFSSFGSQEIDDGSVVFLVEASDIPSDGININDKGDSEEGN